MLASCAAPLPPTKPLQPDPPYTAPQHVIPAELNVVARIDWARAGTQQVRPEVLGYIRAVGIDERMLEPLQGCLDQAATLWIGMRLARAGFEGDSLLIVAGRAGEAVPCDAKGWQPGAQVREVSTYVPDKPDEDRRAAGLLARDPRGFVLVASTAQVDPVLRILREGPDQDHLEPASDSLVSVEARLGPDTIPDGLRGKVPFFADMARGIEHVRLQADAPGPVKVRVALSYGSAQDAKKAGELLTRFRNAMTGSEKPAWQAAASSAHASVFETMLKLSFEVPR